MSAFLVGNDLIDLFVTVATEGAPHSRDLRVLHDGALHVFTSADADTVGQLLIDANVASVNFRYRDIDVPPVYKFRRVPNVGGYGASLFDVLHGLNCYDYQSCEMPNYTASMAANVIVAIRHKVIERMIPEGTAWEWSRETARKREDDIRGKVKGA